MRLQIIRGIVVVTITFVILLFSVERLPAQTLSPENLYAKCKGSVVTIMTFDSNRAPLGQGSGFIVAPNRVATNYHVVEGSSSASIVFSDGSMTVATTVVSDSAPKDLVILEAETGNRPPLVLGNELQLRIGETIYAIGSPRGLTSSLSNGLVSAFRQEDGQFLIQITASIAPGSSGGPLLNSQGQVVGVTTSRLKDGSFGFATGAADLQQVLKVPLAIKLDLSDLTSDDHAAPQNDASPHNELDSVQALYDQKKYDEAKASFSAVPESTKTTFNGQLLLCKIEQQRSEYSDAINACETAIKARPNASEPYGVEAIALLMLGNAEKAESVASKAASLSGESYYKKLLGMIHYSDEKYDLALKDLPTDSDDTFVLTLLTGAAFHTRAYDSFSRFRTRLTTLKPDNGWAHFTDAIAAQRELNWDRALQSYRDCDKDSDFIDPICSLGAMETELKQANYGAAKEDLDKLLNRHPKNRDVLSQAIFLELLLDNAAEADRLHASLKSVPSGPEGDGTDCLYYYGRNQPRVAASYCTAAIRANETYYSTWSNAGYVALDTSDFQGALSYFGKAAQLFYASNDKHTVTQELDLSWGTVIARYYSGDEKGAKSLFHSIKKTYPQFVTSAALKQLPLVWSDTTTRLIDAFTAKIK